ncbi:hypothetical protein [Arthrobacter sp. Rue61a]|uniref:hypothetical protein n=1 Tax=Arthrobacter sp. Rue61a TaxID=1118963 RepID=UPI000150AE92|nr:hypothetical protein [Arthrobacter sp. Rue61a]AFR34593.1 putative typeII /IV secretion system integral membrane protein, TadC -like protein [Arthrobacter sp. Rue61a]
MWPLALIIGAVAGLGLTLLIFELVPKQPKLSAALERLGTTTVEDVSTSRNINSLLGSWAQRHLSGITGFGIPARDLSLLNITAQTHLATKVKAAAAGILALIVLSAVFWLFGLPPLFPAVPAIAAVPLGLGLAVLVDAGVKQQAVEAREEFSRAVATYFELVAAERRRGSPAQHALSEAAGVADSWVFRRIRQELLRASLQSQMPWNALRELSEEIGVKELRDLADIMQLSGEEDAAVYESLRARGKSLRSQMVTDEHQEGNKQTERMTVPMTLLGAVFMAILITAPLLTLMAV